MFFSIVDNGPDENSSENGSHQGDAGPNDFGFYFYFTVKNIIEITTVVLNSFVAGLIVTHRKKTLGTTFYALTAVLMVVLFAVGIINFVDNILLAGFGVRSGPLDWICTLTNIYTSYISVILIWLLGLNRMAIFVLPRFNEIFFTKKIFAILMVVILIVMVFVTFWFSHLVGVKIDNGTTYASNLNLLVNINLISYCIPLSSCLFYVKLYFHLKRNRRMSGNVTTDTLNKAEINTAWQGVVILITYLSSMIMHIAMGSLFPRTGTLKMYMNGLKDVLEALPQLVVPISTVVFSREMQRIARGVLCMRSGTTSTSTVSVGSVGHNRHKR